MVSVRFALLGRMEVTTPGGVSLLPRSRKARAVLALLAMTAPRPVLREHLCGLLWSRRDREQARGSLRQCVREIQIALQAMPPGVLLAERHHLALDSERIQVDVATGGSGLGYAHAGAVEAALRDDGPLLEDLVGLDPAFDRWLDAERLRLRRTARALAEAALTGRADHEGRALAARRLLAIDPGHETAWQALIEALAQGGDRPAALEAYQRCSVALAETSGAAPNRHTRELVERLRAGDTRGAVELTPRARGQAGRGVRLGVLPLRDIDGGDAALSLGLAEEITTALARFRWIFLVASSSLFGSAAAPLHDTLAGALDLDFLLDGVVQRGQGRVRISVRLLDARAAGQVVWAGRFERPASDVLNLQDEIAAEIVAQVDPELLLREGARVAVREPVVPSAYELVLSAIPAIYRLEKASFLRAGQGLARAVTQDPSYAAAAAWWACWHFFLVGQGWADDPGQAMKRAGSLAEQAVRLDPADARALTIAGHVRAFLHHEVDAAMALHERALSLNPNLPLAWVLSGLCCAYAGRHDASVARIEQYRRLSPFDPQAYFFDAALMVPLLLRGDYAAAVEVGRRALQLHPRFSSILKTQVAALAHLGDHEGARAALAQLLELEPGFSIGEAMARSPLVRESDRLIYAEGLRLAGLRD